MSTIKKIEVGIKGMHCSSCEILIERKLKSIPGIEKVNVTQGKAEIYYTKAPSLDELNNAVKSDGYTISSEVNINKDTKNRNYLEAGAVFLVILGLYLILKQINIIPNNFGVSDNVSYGLALVIGLIASVSTCLAVTGGLLLTISAKYTEAHPNLNKSQKFKPHLYFNLGRLASYAVLGGLIGLIGSALSFSPQVTGVITVFVSMIMVVLGIQMLHIMPWFNKFKFKMPKSIAHKLYDDNGEYKESTPFMMGAATFFLPCGFTQALQLYVLTKGDPIIGGLTMFAFALGTMPALLSLGAVSSITKGTTQKYFLKFSAGLIIVLGIINISSGLAATGNAVILDSGNSNIDVNDPNVQIIDGKQVINMQVDSLDYYPARFKIKQGMPVEWHVDGTNAQGCAKIISVPKLRIQELLNPGDNVINFVPNNKGKIQFSCSMGMAGPGVFEVV